MVLENLDGLMKKLNPFLTPYTKFNSKYYRHKYKRQNYKTLGRIYKCKYKVSICDLGLVNGIFNATYKAQATKGKNKLKFTKTKNFCAQKTTLRKLNDT